MKILNMIQKIMDMGYVKILKNKILGAFFHVKDINTLKNVINRLTQ